MITANIQSLRAQVNGTVITPDHAGYNQTRQGWDLAIDQYPAVIVVAANVEDVATAVRFANANDLAIAVQSTGHGVSEPGNDAMLIITARMNSLSVNAEAQTACVQAGVIWKQVVDAGQADGLAPLLGSSPYVGVVGYTLGGGMGWLARKYGYSADSVNMIEIVTPDGEIRHASATENTDLFWGVRGGGANFGVVTGMEIRLYPVKVLYGGTLWYPMEMYRDALHFFREWVQHVPDDMTSSITLLSLPNFPDVPEPMRGKKFTQIKMGFSGAPEWGALLADEWRNWAAPIIDEIGVMPFSEVGKISDDPIDPLPAYVSNELFDTLSDEAIDIIVRYSTDEQSTILFNGIRHMGGAMAKADRSANAIGNRDAQFVMELGSIIPTPEAEDVVVAYMDAIKDALYSHVNGGIYLNFMGRREVSGRSRDAYAPGTYERLAALKAKYDPNNRFRFSFSLIAAAQPVEAVGEWETEMDAVFF